MHSAVRRTETREFFCVRLSHDGGRWLPPSGETDKDSYRQKKTIEAVTEKARQRQRRERSENDTSRWCQTETDTGRKKQTKINP